MKKLIILLLVCATILVACTKLEDSVALRSQDAETTHIIVDFTSFPAHSTYTIVDLTGGSRYRFDSDSLKYFVQDITVGNYQTTWRILDIKEDSRYKAKMVNQNQGTVTDWKNSVIQINGHELGGSYVFTRVDR